MAHFALDFSGKESVCGGDEMCSYTSVQSNVLA
jgi:hypothetical protein